MSNTFASARNSIACCDRCGFQFKLKQLRRVVIKTKDVNILVCKACWTPDHPQLQLGMYPVSDPQAVRNPRPDNTYKQSGLLANGNPGEGSRIIQWGWNPVGGASGTLTPNALVLTVEVGDVTVATQ